MVLAASALSCTRREAPPAPTRPATVPTTASAPVPAPPTDAAAMAQLARLESSARQGVAQMDHGAVTRAVTAMEALALADLANATRRNILAEGLRAQAVSLRDAQHRFLFGELEPLSPGRRRAVLSGSDRGEAGIIARAAAALAEAQFAAGARHIRATASLDPRTIDPASGLPVRKAGDVRRIWQNAFNLAFNDRMRKLLSGASM